MFVAIGLSRHRHVVAEPEALGARFADRPAARRGGSPRLDRCRRQGWPRRRRADRLSADGARAGRLYRPQRLNIGRCRRRGWGDMRACQGRQRRTSHPRKRGGPFTRWFGVSPDRRGTSVKLQTVRLADNCVFRNTKAAADFRRRKSLGPEIPQQADRFIIPYHMRAPLQALPTKYSMGLGSRWQWKIRYRVQNPVDNPGLRQHRRRNLLQTRDGHVREPIIVQGLDDQRCLA